ncbi:hypothetical protein KQ875_00015 [Mycoplasma zalophi]|uniref:DUF31 domain-containing protein n=1 Tax=Mycoplasma zalophi TaxID=191287 RepID=A0ABS6DP94_9MOLU|nr:hypothetical protein [Mycoplasma zalophi]MBU4691986.1 hypothetical protein [Mycoplasma zalophi]
MKKTKFLILIPLAAVTPFFLVSCTVNNQNNLTNKKNESNLSAFSNSPNDNSNSNNSNNNENDSSNSKKDNNNNGTEKNKNPEKESNAIDDDNHKESNPEPNDVNNDIEKNKNHDQESNDADNHAGSSDDNSNSSNNNQPSNEPMPNEEEIDNKKELQIAKSTNFNPETTFNSVTYYLEIKNFEEIYSQNLNIQVKLISKTSLYNAEISKLEDKLLLKINFDDLNENTSYKLEKLEISSANKQTSINLVNKDFSFVTLKQNKENVEHINLESNLLDSDRVLINSLQQANSYSNNDQNINTNISDLAKENLKNNSLYSIYFSELDKTFKYEITSNIRVERNLSEVVFNNKIDNNDSVKFTLKNLNNLTPNNVQVLVKGWDGKDVWTKWLQVQKNSNEITLQKNQLNKYLTKYVITAIKDSQNQYKVVLNENNIFLNNTNLHNLEVSHFSVYKDETNKDIFGSLMLNWTNEQANLLRNKVFALTFEAKQKVYVKKSHTEPGGLFTSPTEVVDNKHEQFDDINKVYKFKTIYVNFEDLWKFKLNGLQEKIEYKLSKINIQNKNEYFDIVSPITYRNSSYFNFNFNWKNNDKLINQLRNETDQFTENNSNLVANSLNLSKSQLFANHDLSKNNIPFSISNLSQLINYNYEVHKVKTLYKNRKPYNNPNTNNIEFVDYKILKNNNLYNLYWFKTRDYLAKQPFVLNDQKTEASISKNLNSIVNLDSIPSEDVIFWITFELNPNPQRPLKWTEFNDVFSRVTIPISYKNLLKYNKLENVEFLYSMNSENNEFQADIAAKIKALLSFSIELDKNKILTLKISTKDNKIVLNNTNWLHNLSSERSIFINTADLFVYWIQPNNDSKIISFKEYETLDNLSIKTTSVAYSNTYELKQKTKETEVKNSNGTVSNRDIDNYLEDEVKPEEKNKRLFSEDSSVGIDEARKRAYSLSSKSDGTWNIFAKVNDDPNDYRFWTFSNYHVWAINKSAAAKFATISKSESGNEVLTIKKGQILAPTLISEDYSNKSEPVFYKPGNRDDMEVKGNLYEFNFENSEDKITYEVIADYTGNFKNNFDALKDNLGQTEKDNNDEKDTNKADLLVAIVDFKSIFKKFENKNLNQEIDGKTLTEQEKNAIKHVLSFKTLKPMKISKLSRYMTSYNNLNSYIGSIPKVPTINKDGQVEAARYREYLYGANSIALHLNSDSDISHSYNGAVYTEVENFDLFSGSSGSAVYDHEGKFLGLVKQGTASRINNFIFVDTQKYSYFGNDDTKYNQGTFYAISNKLNYLYPSTFNKVFSDEN